MVNTLSINSYFSNGTHVSGGASALRSLNLNILHRHIFYE